MSGLPDGLTVPPDLIRDALARISASPPFAASERLQRFLEYVVSQTLSGDVGALKEYTIGVVVYDRGDDFDPRTDSIVRTEAARLRRKLAQYYTDHGSAEPVRITLRLGSYVPTFTWVRTSPSPTDTVPAGQLPDGGIPSDASIRLPLGPNSWPTPVGPSTEPPVANPSTRTSGSASHVLLFCGLVLVLAVAALTKGHGRSSTLATNAAAVAHRSIRSIAVEPFEDLVGTPQSRLAASVLSDSLAEVLAGIGDLDRVIARQTMSALRAAGRPTLDGVRQLGVQALVAGTVRGSDERIEISVRLVSVADGHLLWTERFVRRDGDPAGLQADIVRAIAREVRGVIGSVERDRPDVAARPAPEAYASYTAGIDARRRTDLDGAMRAFERAIARSGRFAAAYGELAYTASLLAHFRPPAETLSRARAAAAYALDLDPGTPAARLARGQIRLNADWDWNGAEHEYRLALAERTNDSDAHAAYASYLAKVRRFDEAVAQAARAVTLDPLSVEPQLTLAWCLLRAGRNSEALDSYLRVLALDAGSDMARYQIAWAKTFGGDYTGAAEAYRAFYDERSRAPSSADARRALFWGERRDPFLAYLRALSGSRSEALSTVRTLAAQAASPASPGAEYTDPIYVALVYTALGDRASAFAWLDRAYATRSYALALVPSDPFFRPLHGDPRFESLMERMGFPR